jgi:hypothetical protein
MHKIELFRYDGLYLDFCYYVGTTSVQKSEPLCELSFEELINFKEHCNQQIHKYKNIPSVMLLFYTDLYDVLNKEQYKRKINKIIKLKEIINVRNRTAKV